MWLLSIHGFLYATYGLTLQKKLEIVEKISLITSKAGPPPYLSDTYVRHYMSAYNLSSTVTYISGFLILITLVGLAISTSALVSILAAKTATDNLQAIFQQNFTVEPTHEDKNNRGTNIEGVVNIAEKSWLLPDIAGGGKRRPGRNGRLASIAIPIILGASWAISLIMLFCASYPKITVSWLNWVKVMLSIPIDIRSLIM